MAPRTRAALALALLVPVPTLSVLTAMAWWPGPGGQMVYGAGKLWLLGLPLFWLLRVEKRRPSWSPPRRGGLAVGALLGLGISAVIFSAWWLTDPADGALRTFRIPPETIRSMAETSGIATPARYLVLTLYLTLLNSVLEEYVWRWFVVRRAEEIFPAPGAIAASALFFTVHHVAALRLQMPWPPAILASAGVFLGGVIWSWCYVRYRSIWPGWVSHAIVDAAIFVIGWILIFERAGASS